MSGPLATANSPAASPSRSSQADPSTENIPKSAPAAPLNNSDVLTLKQAGISDSLIIEKIRSSPVKFELGTTDLVALKKSGLADAVIAAMLEASRR
jgi:hypothetical protein